MTNHNSRHTGLDNIKCRVCQQNKDNRLHLLVHLVRQFTNLYIDLVGPFIPSRGYFDSSRSILSRASAYLIENTSAKIIAKTLIDQCIVKFFYNHHRSWISIPITTFQFKEFTRLLGIQHIKTTVYHSCSNGMVERFLRQNCTSDQTICHL